jgi:hypothetical protein
MINRLGALQPVFKLPHLLIATCVFSHGLVAAQAASHRAPTVTEVDGAELYRARHVLRRFYANERHPECYRVLFSEFEGNLRIDFIPKSSDTLVLEESAPEPIEGSVPCGENVGYIVDQRGKVIRRIYSR